MNLCKTDHKTETAEHKTVNNTILNKNEVLTTLWKLSQDHTPFIHKTGEPKDKRIILYEGSKLELQHTRKTLETLSWVYKDDDHPMVIGCGSPCGHSVAPTKTGMALRCSFLRQCDSFNGDVGQIALSGDSMTTTSSTLSLRESSKCSSMSLSTLGT